MECFGPAMNRQLGPRHLGEAPAAPRPTSAGGAVIETEGRNVLMREKKKMSEILEIRARHLNQTIKPSDAPSSKSQQSKIFILAPKMFGMPLSWRALFFVLFF